MMSPLVTLNKMTCAIAPLCAPVTHLSRRADRNAAKQTRCYRMLRHFRHGTTTKSARSKSELKPELKSEHQVGCTILQPASATEPAASSPDTKAATVNTSSGPDLGVCTSPTKMFRSEERRVG